MNTKQSALLLEYCLPVIALTILVGWLHDIVGIVSSLQIYAGGLLGLIIARFIIEMIEAGKAE